MIRMRNHGNHKVELIENITRKSSLFSLFKEKDFESFEKNDTTVFIHRFGITPEMFYNEKDLVENFILTSFSYDLDGVKFIDSIENNNLHIIFFIIFLYYKIFIYMNYFIRELIILY